MIEPLIIVQARIGGSRFPGKMLAPLCGQPVILWTLQRCAQLPLPHKLVVALPSGEEQAPLRQLCERHGYLVEQPDVLESYVLSRYQRVAEQYNAETIVRVTGDCPLVDPEVIAGCLRVYQDPFRRVQYDHVGIGAEWMEGMDCEVFTRNALELAEFEATDAADQEHVSSFIWRQPRRFQCGTYPCPFDLTAYQTSIDTETDLLLAQSLLSWCMDRYGFGFGWRDLWWCLESQTHLKYRMLQRAPRNQSYVAQVGGETWEEIRYGCGL